MYETLTQATTDNRSCEVLKLRIQGRAYLMVMDQRYDPALFQQEGLSEVWDDLMERMGAGPVLN